MVRHGRWLTYRQRAGQSNIEYAIILGVLLLASIAGIVLLNQRIANLVNYSIEVTTEDDGQNSPNPSVESGTIVPLRQVDGEWTLDRPSTFQENTGIDNLDVLVDEPE